ncbi:MAG: MFS transporter [Chloroflexi bacterium]|nr:MFS transporter [Chloroflexota bacterium]
MKLTLRSSVSGLWTPNLILLASATFLVCFGQGLFGGVRTNFFIDTLGLTGGQVLWLEGIREIPGLALMFIAAAVMHLPLAWQTAAYTLIMGLGYGLQATVGSYSALIAMALVASLGMHGWMPLNNALAMSLTTKDKSGRVLGAISSVTAMASIVGMGVVAITTRLTGDISLRLYFAIGGGLIVLGAFLIARLPRDVGSTGAIQPRMLLSRRYWLYYVLTFLEGSRKQVLGTFTSLVLVDRHSFEVWEISLLLLISSVVNFVSAPWLGRLLDTYGERSTLTVSYVLLALCCVGCAVVQSAWVLSVLVILIHLLLILGMGLSTYVNRVAPPEELAPTLSAGISINHVTSVGMPLVAGLLLPLVQYSGIFWGTAAIILLSVPFTLAIRATPLCARELAPAAAK